MNNLFKEVTEKLRLEKVVKEWVKLEKDGTYLKGICPFCDSEIENEFVISPSKQVYYCFSCHNGGDVVTFISNKKNITQVEAMFHLADKYNINFFKNDEAWGKKVKEIKASLLKAKEDENETQVEEILKHFTALKKLRIKDKDEKDNTDTAERTSKANQKDC